MKRLIIIFTLLSLLFLCSCNPSRSQSTESTVGFTTRTATYDEAGRIMQEITHNTNSGLTIITSYTYSNATGLVLVVDVAVIIIDAEGNRIE